MQLRHLLIALLVPLTWGFGFALAKAGLDHFPPLLLMSMPRGPTWVATPVARSNSQRASEAPPRPKRRPSGPKLMPPSAPAPWAPMTV